ncbi:MAG: hypothetical protein AAF648_06630 [Pseudomonadota bacterium]
MASKPATDAGTHIFTGATKPMRIGGIPWLFPEPEHALHQWRNRWHRELRRLEALQAECRSLAAAARGADAEHLTLRAVGYGEHKSQILEVLKPLGLGEAATAATFEAAQGSDDWVHYDANILRDWCWGAEENSGSLSQVLLATGTRPQRVLVIGSGAGRLAFDLHRTLVPEQTIALEHNPLLALLSHRLMQGERLPWTEFVTNPHPGTPPAINRELKAPANSQPLAPGFTQILADIRFPPFRPGTFDLVLTSWFVDICPTPLSWLAELIHDLLTPAGQWLYHGSTAFGQNPSGGCHSIDAFLELTARAGFDCTYDQAIELPYLASPAHRQQRLESVSTFAFTRDSKPSAKRLAPYKHAQEPWIKQRNAQVPLTPAIAQHRDAAAMRAFLLSLIDGKRSRREMAALIAERGIMTAGDAEAFLIDLIESTES